MATLATRASFRASSAQNLLLYRVQYHARASSRAWAAALAQGAGGACSVLAPRACRRPRRGCLQVVAASGGSYNPYPWAMADYHRVALQMVQTAPPGALGTQQGYFLLMRVGHGEEVEDQERGLVMAVGGDTLAGVAQLAQGLPTGAAGGRPLSLDLLWQVLERGQEISKRSWGILRVAVVELRGSTFVGRIFFGDPASGVVAWDCDCRPSDACWLALKSRAPIYVHKGVWEECAMMLQDLQRSAEQQATAAARLHALDELQPDKEEVGANLFALMTTPRPADPEPLKRLKMEMRVAIKDEDYAAAARIRDHPWMRLHLSYLRAAQHGDVAGAEAFEAKLQAELRQHDREAREELKRLEAEQQRRQKQQDSGSGGGDPRGPGRQFW